jgi:hypoxanthine phosphoribosyltransferase
MTAPTKYNHVSWSDVDEYCMDIVAQMDETGYRPDCIIGLTKGGVVPARIVADYFDLDMDFIDVKYYDGINQRMSKPKIEGSDEFFGNFHLHKRMLVVDDIWDTGDTMMAVVERLIQPFRPHKLGAHVTTATLFWKEGASKKPDYYAGVAKPGEWINFPWERYEFQREVKKLKE